MGDAAADTEVQKTFVRETLYSSVEHVLSGTLSSKRATGSSPERGVHSEFMQYVVDLPKSEIFETRMQTLSIAAPDQVLLWAGFVGLRSFLTLIDDSMC